MIPLLLLMILHFSVAAIPITGEQDPILLAIEDMEGLLYELPEYEDPDLVDYQISSLGGIPVVSLLEMAKKHLDTKNKNLTQKEKDSDTKKHLHDVISKLHIAHSKLEKGNPNIYYDIQKAIQSLKNIEQKLRPDSKRLLTIRKHMSGDYPKEETLNTTPALEFHDKDSEDGIGVSIPSFHVEDIPKSEDSTPTPKVVSSRTSDEPPYYETEPPLVKSFKPKRLLDKAMADETSANKRKYEEVVNDGPFDMSAYRAGYEPETSLQKPDVSDDLSLLMKDAESEIKKISVTALPEATAEMKLVDAPVRNQFTMYENQKEGHDERFYQRRMSWR